MSQVVAGDASGLAGALRALGLPCEVEGRAGLALVTTAPEHAAGLAAADTRRTMLALAREHGFTHLAVELSLPTLSPGAPVLRD